MDSPRVDYFRDCDFFVACIDQGDGGMFTRLGDGQWEFVIPGSVQWSALHQDISWAHHDLDRCDAATIAALPPLPPVPPFERIRWKDNFEPKAPLRVADYPALTARVESSPGQRVSFWFVLEEDRYETCFGDGEFHHFHGTVFDSGEAAIALADAGNALEKKKEQESGCYGTVYEVKSLEVVIEGQTVKPGCYEPETFEEYEIQTVLQRIEETLASGGALPWGTRRREPWEKEPENG